MLVKTYYKNPNRTGQRVDVWSTQSSGYYAEMYSEDGSYLSRVDIGQTTINEAHETAQNWVKNVKLLNG
jgi:hypothetical protein